MLTLLLFACGPKDAYELSLPQLAVRFNAKMTCSCVFVSEQDATYCQEWTRVDPDIAKATIDYDEQVVTSRALLFWSHEARYTPEGCTLE